ncbi:MAG TPA: hypothetical protein VKB19_08405 [Pedobacter sp.]|nr:hypothetical protein [Pedobacter sp.]
MLKALSYLNIFLAIAYFFGYLLNSFSWPIAAILLIIVYNGLVIRNIERELKFSPVHYTLAFFNLLFAGFLTLWIINVVQSSIEVSYFGNTGIYIVMGTLFVFSIIAHVLLLIRKF